MEFLLLLENATGHGRIYEIPRVTCQFARFQVFGITRGNGINGPGNRDRF